MLPPPGRSPLQLARRTALWALLLLIFAGLRHHLVWGESPRLPFSLRPLLDLLETACLVGFAWLGTRAWLGAMAAVRERSPGLPQLLRSSLPLLLLAMLVPAFLSADVADYVMRGRVLAVHGANPYVHFATDFPGDAFLAFGDQGWKAFPLPYGPLVADLQAVVVWIAHRFDFLPPRLEFLLAVLLFKLVFAGCLVACAVTARGISAQLRPAEQDVAFVAVLWNPLLLNEGLAQAHNESLVLLTLLLAVRATLAGRVGAGAFVLGLGVLTKIVPLLLAPVLFVWAVRRRRLPQLCTGAAAALLVFGLYYWRFFAEPGAFDFLRRQSGITGASLPWAASTLLGVTVSQAVNVGRVCGVLLVLVAMLRLWRRPEPMVLVHGCAVSMAGLVCFGLGNLGPWYHVWWLPLALLGGAGWLHRFAGFATLFAPLGYVVWTMSRTFGEAHDWVQLTMALLLPALAACLGGVRAKRLDDRAVAP